MINVVSILEHQIDPESPAMRNPNLSLEQKIEQATLTLVHQFALLPGCFLVKNENNAAAIFNNGKLIPIPVAIKAGILRELDQPIILDYISRQICG